MTEQKSTSELDELLGNPFGELEITNPATTLQKVEEKPRRLIDSLPEESKQKAIGLAQQIDPKNHSGHYPLWNTSTIETIKFFAFHAGSCSK